MEHISFYQYLKRLISLKNSVNKFFEEQSESYCNTFMEKLTEATIPTNGETQNRWGRYYTYTLKHSWVVSMDYHKSNNEFTIKATNDCEYALFVEYGHLTRNHQSYVPGVYMMTTTDMDMKNKAGEIYSKNKDTLLKLLNLDKRTLSLYNKQAPDHYKIDWDSYNT